MLPSLISIGRKFSNDGLTPLGFFLVQSKIDITIGDDGFILAKGRNCDSFDYGDEGWQNNGEHSHDARDWMGLDKF